MKNYVIYYSRKVLRCILQSFVFLYLCNTYACWKVFSDIECTWFTLRIYHDIVLKSNHSDWCHDRYL